MPLSVKASIDKLNVESAREALGILLSPHFNPVFGAAKTIEHEVAAFSALQQLGFLSAAPEPFELITKLRVTKAKASSLLYQVELRRSSDDTYWDDRIKQVLFSTAITKDGDYYGVSIRSPLLKETTRHKLATLDVTADDSFATDILRIPANGFMKLVVSLMTPQEQKLAKANLIMANVPVSSVGGLVQGLAIKFGEKFAGDAGGALGKEAAQWIKDLFVSAAPAQQA
jgi:hypothetical protein